MTVDPARWPGAVQTAFLGLFALAYGAFVLLSDGWDLSWLAVPLFGALVWRYEGLAVWEIASWTIPLGIFMAVASATPGTFGLVAGLVGVGIVVLMTFLSPAAAAWLAFIHRLRGGSAPPDS